MWWLDDIAFGPDPFSELRRLQRDMNRLFTGYQGDRESFPAVNVWANDENVLVTAELPGMDADSIDISVQGDQFLLRGERKPGDMADDVACHRLERGAGTFSRSFRLPYEVNSDRVTAKYTNGVLTVALPRAETSKPKKIEIKGA